jgi:hypothetical protein
MKAKSILLGFVMSLGIFGCEKEKAIPIVSDTFSISYTKGISWFDYSYKATIDQKGFLRVVENNRLANLRRTSEYRITDIDLALIKNYLIKVASIDINDKYGFGENKPIGLPVRIIQYDVDNSVDSTSVYYPEMNELPEELNSFLTIIEHIILENDTLAH